MRETRDDQRQDGLEACRFQDDGRIPNSRLPLVLMRSAVAPDPSNAAAAFERTFAANGWTGLWRDGIFGFHHYHSTAHEVLGIAAGGASVRFGGEAGTTVEVQAGDVVVIPAGIGHKLIEARGDLLVVGGYAEGREPDTLRDDPSAIAAARRRIAAVPLPKSDPVHGRAGPLHLLWRSE
jgi:uncharacterized protein YjlB